MWRSRSFILTRLRGGRRSSSSSSKVSPVERVECVVVGAGVVGLAVARAMAMRGREVLIVEAASTIGTGTSSRNSEVIHAGIYYPNSTSKALLCVRGKHALYSYCQDRGIPFQQIGKLIVATKKGQIPKLQSIYTRGLLNGVTDLRFLSSDQAYELEPNLKCFGALLSPSTGIVDSHSFMLSLQADAEDHGATFAFNSAVTHGRIVPEGIQLSVCDAEALRSKDIIHTSMVLHTKILVNAAGLNAISLARSLDGFPSHAVPPSFFARGCYFSFAGSDRPPFSRLIYPIPEEGGLGVHVTLDLAGQVKFGPDVEWLNIADSTAEKPYKLEFDYSVDPRRAEKFYPEIRKYYPSLQDGMLNADYSGIRPKISGPGNPPADFLIQCQKAHSIPGLVNLFGIESPGLTASLAIADEVVTATENT